MQSSPAPPKNEVPVRSHSRGLGFLLLAIAALAMILGIAAPSFFWGSIRAKAEPATGDTSVLFVTSGLTWDAVTEESMPELSCFARSSGVAGMSLTSASVMPTKRQGMLSLETGERTPALSQLPSFDTLAAIGAAGPTATDAARSSLTVRIAGEDTIRVINLGDASVGTPLTSHERQVRLTAIDEAFAKEAGTCGENFRYGSGNRAAVASMGSLNPQPQSLVEIENHRSHAGLATPLQLQVYIDSGWGSAYLTSPSTRQVGVVMQTDLAATLTNQPQVGIGRTIVGTLAERSTAPPSNSHPALSAPVDRARDISITSRVTEDSLGWVLGGIVTLMALLAALSKISPLARSALAISPLAIPVALTSARLPLPLLVEHGIAAPLALGAYVLLATAALGTLVFLGCTRISPSAPALPLAVSALAMPAALCLEVMLGSYSQFTSLLGNQPIYGGRFYGISNHLAGIMLACWALGVGAMIHSVRALTYARRAALNRVLLVGLTGAAIGAVAIMPTMGADAGSALIYAPVTLVACLAVSGIRLTPWHIVAALTAGIGIFVLAGIADYLRPVDKRTHLGEFVASIIDRGSLGGGIEQFWVIFSDRTMRMLEPLWLYGALVIVPALLLAAGLTAFALWPTNRARTLRYAWAIRGCALGGAWIGALTNDTGLVLVGLAYVFGALLSVSLWRSGGLLEQKSEAAS